MSQRILDTISSPADLKDLSYEQLDELAQEIRGEIIAVCSMNGGHLASSLGAVELIIALHRVLNCPRDRIVFDVGHQSYAHKLLTGRLNRFETLRCEGGLSGFTRLNEGPYDSHDSGHASDSLSMALGYALARDLAGTDQRIAALIGDASISGGMALEALNFIGQSKTKLTIILNDNEMSISRNVGALSLYLGRARTSRTYLRARDGVENRLNQTGTIGRTLAIAGEVAKRSVKNLMVPGMLFEDLGLTYIGPIDGHSIADVEEAVTRAQRIDGPVIIHAVTRKGAGYAPAEKRPDLFHGVGPFDIDTGKPLPSAPGPVKYTKVFGDALVREAEANPRIVAITAAMTDGTGLAPFARRFRNRFFDVGIAEENATAMAGGLALGGQLPVVAIYSTFLQRAFDQIATDVCLPNAHVVLALDRAGLVGADGPTHHGVFDIPYLRILPNMKVLAPSNEAELANALHTALALSGPVALRYPRGAAEGVELPEKPQAWELGAAGERYQPAGQGDPRVSILAVGRVVGRARAAADLLAQKGISCRVTDMRWVKPVDEVAVREAASSQLVVTAEEGVVAGGFGSAVLESLSRQGLCPETLQLGIPDRFVEQGPVDSLLAKVGLSPEAIAQRIEETLATLGARG